MMPDASLAGIGLWRFAKAELNEQTQSLKIDGQTVALEDQAFGVLLCLLRADGELVTRAEILETVWAGQAPDDHALPRAIQRLREVLGDDDAAMLCTVQEFGYRLGVPVSFEDLSPDGGTRLQLSAGQTLASLPGWVLDERLQTRPSNELWRVRACDADEMGVLKLALDTRAERALRREVTLNRVLLSQLGAQAPLVPLLQWQFDSRPHWIRMPWYASGSLSDWIAARGGADQVALARRVRIVAETAETLAQAHALGIMHKDIKPGNLLVDESGAEPRILLCDFGNGAAHSRAHLAQVGVTVMGFTQTIASDHTSGSTSTTGTPAYMAPEILSGGIFSERSDVYSLGVMLYQLASGEMNRPLAEGWEDDVADPGLRRIIQSACAGRPERRLASMQAFAGQLRAWTPNSASAADGGMSDMRLSAIMFTDMVGYSSLVRRDETLAREMLDMHIAMMRELLPKHQGREIEIIGDAFLVEFASAVLAVQCAVEFQQLQAQYNDTAPASHQFRIRIGIHIGDVERRDGKVFGHGVNYAARIEPLAPPGGLAVSPTVRDAVAPRLNLPFRSLGRKQLKNVAENIEVFALDEMSIRSGGKAEAAGARPHAERRRRTALAGLAAMLAVAGVLIAGFMHAPADVPGAAAGAPRIAALRFTQSISDPAQARPLSGIYDAIVTDLSQVSQWDLIALDRLETDNPQLEDYQQIHARLGLDTLIRGSIQQSGEALRLNLQIMDLQTGVSRWGRRFEGRIDELFGLQDRASRGLLEALGGKMQQARPAALGLGAQAYADYLSVLAIAEADNYFLGSPLAYDEALDAMDRVLAQNPQSTEVYLLAIRLFSVAHFYSRMDYSEARSRLDQALARLDSLGASAAQAALARATIQYGLELRSDLAFDSLAPHREALRNRSDYQTLLPQVAWHGGHQRESYELFARRLALDPLDYPSLITWADRMGFGQQPVEAYALLNEAQSRFPEHPEMSALAASFAWWATGEEGYLQTAIDVSLRLTLRSTRLFEAAFDGYYRRGDLAGALHLIDQVPIPMLWTAHHQIIPMPLIRAWLINAMDGPQASMQRHAQRGLDMLGSARARSDSPGRMATASSALALLGRDDEALALAQAALADAQGNTQDHRQVANLVLITLGILGNEEQALALLHEEMAKPLNGDLCLRVSHAMRWHDLRQLPRAQALLDAHCAQLAQERAAAIRQIDASSLQAGLTADGISLAPALAGR